MAELFPQDTSTVALPPSDDLIRAEGTRRAPEQPTEPDDPSMDWAKIPLYRAPDVQSR